MGATAKKHQNDKPHMHTTLVHTWLPHIRHAEVVCTRHETSILWPQASTDEVVKVGRVLRLVQFKVPKEGEGVYVAVPSSWQDPDALGLVPLPAASGARGSRPREEGPCQEEEEEEEAEEEEAPPAFKNLDFEGLEEFLSEGDEAGKDDDDDDNEVDDWLASAPKAKSLSALESDFWGDEDPFD